MMDQSTAVLQAINTLYYVHDAEQKKQANAFLESFQRQPDAWIIADQLLNAPNIPVEPQVFGAQTLRRKIRHDLQQLDEKSALSLRDNIIRLLKARYAHGSRMICTQLCVALAGLALQLPAWVAPMEDMQREFGSQHFMLLLEWLTVLPEECRHSTVASAGDEGQAGYAAHEARVDLFAARTTALLTSNADNLVQLLFHALQTIAAGNSEMQSRIMYCLVSWMRTNDLVLKNLAHTPILDIGFQAVRSDDMFDAGCDLLCEMIRECTSATDHAALVMSKICDGLGRLGDVIESAFTDDGHDKQQALTRLFVEAGETVWPRMIEDFDQFMPIMRGILRCTAFDDLEVVPITFDFWYELSRSLISASASVKQPFLGPYRTLLGVMMTHLRYPDDPSSWTAEERDNFRSFRHDVGDVLKDCVIILGEQDALSRPLSHLQAFLANPSSTPWQDIEACLFAFRAMGAEISSKENSVMPQVITMVTQLPNHPKLRYGAALVLGRYSDWTKEHPETIALQLQFISECFGDSEVISAASLALKHLCESCGEGMVQYLDELCKFFATLSGKVSRQEMQELTEATAHIVRHVPLGNLGPALVSLTDPILAEVNLKMAAFSPADADAIKQIEYLLSRLNILFKYVAPPVPAGQIHPCVNVLQQCIPTLESILDRSNASILRESVCKILKNSVISFDINCMPILPWMVAKVISCYQLTRDPCFLWLASHIVRRMASKQEPALTTALVNMVQNLASVTVQVLSAPAQFDADPDTVEDFCRLMYPCLTSLPVAVFDRGAFPHILQFCLTGLSANSPSVVENCSELLRNIFSSASSKDDRDKEISSMFRELMPQFTPVLFKTMLSRILGVGDVPMFSPEVFPHCARIIMYSIEASSSEDIRRLSQSILSSIQQQEPKLTSETCHEFLSALEKNSKVPDHLRYAIATLSCSIRGNPRRNPLTRKSSAF